jgi:hypothetical protein
MNETGILMKELKAGWPEDFKEAYESKEKG